MNNNFSKFTVSIFYIYRCIQKIKAEEMAELGLKHTYLSCLFYLLGKPDGMTAGELCSACQEDKAAISRSINELEKVGYLSKDNKTKYKNLIKLTPLGISKAESVSKKIDELMEIGGKELTSEERETFYKALDKICKGIQKICDEIYGGEND